MRVDYLNIGSSPVAEECAQVGSDGYFERAQEECKRYIAQLREQFGPEPAGARLKVKSFPHDFGTYYEVVCLFEVGNEEAEEYAYACEGDAWQEWRSNGRQG